MNGFCAYFKNGVKFTQMRQILVSFVHYLVYNDREYLDKKRRIFLLRYCGLFKLRVKDVSYGLCSHYINWGGIHGDFRYDCTDESCQKTCICEKIILPPIFMSSGALMFIFPMFRVTPLELIEAVTVGLLFSILLIKTSKFEIRDNDIYLKRSRAFIYILISLLVIRVLAKLVLSATIDVGQLGGMFWILAFGMIVPWRIAMYVNYRKLQQQLFDDVPTKTV